VKRSMAWTVGLLSLGAAVYFGSQLWAQPATRPAASAQTRVAVLNLRWVIKNYAKYQTFIDLMKAEEKKYITELTAKQKQLEEKAKEAEKIPPADAKRREAIEQEARNIQRDMEDIKLRARKEVAQKSNDEMVKVYKEVRDAAYRHAQSQGFDLVLHFEGPADSGEVDSPVLVTRNMNAGGCVPLYWNPNLDISASVLKALNAPFRDIQPKTAPK
jgi:Skp family chaperone for outer membrane proteins